MSAVKSHKMPSKTVVDGNVTTEIVDMTGGVTGAMSADDLMKKMGGKAGTYTETKPDGTVVTYELDVEEFEVGIKRELLNRMSNTLFLSGMTKRSILVSLCRCTVANVFLMLVEALSRKRLNLATTQACKRERENSLPY